MFLLLHLRVGFYVAKFHVHSCIALKALKSLKHLDRQQKTHQDFFSTLHRLFVTENERRHCLNHGPNLKN